MFEIFGGILGGALGGIFRLALYHPIKWGSPLD